MTIQKFTIFNRWTGKAQIEAEIDCSEDAPLSVKIGLAVRWGLGSRADLSDADLRGADLSGADLCGANLSDADLCGANLSDADLCGAKLSDADLHGANLNGADLHGANLRGADLRGAKLSGAHLSCAPIIPNIDAAILAAIESPGNSLGMSDWHICNTTHCRAGWAIALAGEAGAELEREYGPNAAGAMIYAASRPGQALPNFYASNEVTLDDLRTCAAQQIATTNEGAL